MILDAHQKRKGKEVFGGDCNAAMQDVQGQNLKDGEQCTVAMVVDEEATKKNKLGSHSEKKKLGSCS